MLKEVFSECYANEIDEDKAYKSADKCFRNLLKKYKLNDKKYIDKFKMGTNHNEYNFTEEHIQLLKFMNEIYNISPDDRKNPSSEKLTLDNLDDVASTVEKIINEEKYPAINDKLKTTLRTPEFLSLHSLHDLVKKITLLFQYVCSNNYSDFNIYNQVNEYLDTLLYTYAGHEHYSDFMNEVYYKPLGITMFHGYDNKVEFNKISLYRGIKQYVQKAFDVVTIGDGKSNSIDVDLTQGNYCYVFEFECIEEIKEFILKYCEYFDISSKFKNYCIEKIVKEPFRIEYTRLLETQYLCNSIMNKTIPFIFTNESDKQKNLKTIREAIDHDIKYISSITFDNSVKEKFKMLCKKLKNVQESFIDKYMYNYGNGTFLRINYFINSIITEAFDEIKSPVNDFVFGIVEALFYDGFIIPRHNAFFDFANEFLGETTNLADIQTIEFQLSYKYFKIQLSNIAAIKEQNKKISNKEIVDGISYVLKKIDNQIMGDFKEDNELYSAIGNAVGIYLNKKFEQVKTNQS